MDVTSSDKHRVCEQASNMIINGYLDTDYMKENWPEASSGNMTYSSLGIYSPDHLCSHALIFFDKNTMQGAIAKLVMNTDICKLLGQNLRFSEDKSMAKMPGYFSSPKDVSVLDIYRFDNKVFCPDNVRDALFDHGIQQYKSLPIADIYTIHRDIAFDAKSGTAYIISRIHSDAHHKIGLYTNLHKDHKKSIHAIR